MYRKSLMIFVLVLLAVTSVSARVVEDGGIIYIGETVDLPFVDQCPSKIFGWWYSGDMTTISVPRNKVNINNSIGYFVDFEIFSGYYGTWYCWNSSTQIKELDGPKFFVTRAKSTTVITTVPTTTIQTAATINSSAIATIESQVAEQNVQLQKQQEELDIIQQILSVIQGLLGLQ